MKINPLYKLGLKKLDDDSFLEIIKNVRPKDISTLCAVNKDFAERCKKYNKHICRSVLKNLGFKDVGSIDPCELYKFIKKFKNRRSINSIL